MATHIDINYLFIPLWSRNMFYLIFFAICDQTVVKFCRYTTYFS